jgi:competence protein ComEC
LIVYNVPKQTAIDILNGNELFFIGDSTMIDDPFIQNFHFKPARILNRAERKMKFFPLTNNNVITTPGKKIVIVDAPVQGKRAHHKIKADIIVISKNPRLYISDINDLFECKEIVFDSSNPSWKIEKWKKDCETLHLPFHSVPEEGAFETQL